MLNLLKVKFGDAEAKSNFFSMLKRQRSYCRERSILDMSPGTTGAPSDKYLVLSKRIYLIYFNFFCN
jgi:hypothetical protein